jgi:8-oxo-dGTP diphosphatase
MKPLNTIAYMLIQENCVLAEKRKLTKKVCPGKTAIPGGHVEAALVRELHEELGIVCEDYVFVCTLLHRSAEFRKLNYFVVNSWQGALENNEADALVWIPLDSLDKLDLDVDRLAVSEYLRVYRHSF